MKNKASKIVVSAVSSLVVLFVIVILETLIAGKILGTTKDSSGSEKINGGGAITIALFAIGIVLTLVFAIWFYKFLSRHRIAKIQE